MNRLIKYGNFSVTISEVIDDEDNIDELFHNVSIYQDEELQYEDVFHIDSVDIKIDKSSTECDENYPDGQLNVLYVYLYQDGYEVLSIMLDVINGEYDLV